jgi:dipeptidyl aminopeptidase/acylaminoacyl peptidase
MKRPLLLGLLITSHLHAQGTKADYERAARFQTEIRGKVFRHAVKPHWLPDGSAFWYRNDLSGGQVEHVLVDVATGERRTIANPESLPQTSQQEAPPRREASGRPASAFIRDHNVWVRILESGEEFALTTDGSAENAYREPFDWSPDGSRFVAMKVRPAQRRELVLVESSPKDQLQPKVHRHPYPKPGDRIAHPRPHLFDVAARRAIPIADELFPNPWDLTHLRWAPDSSRFAFLYNERGHQLLRVISVDARSGAASTLIEETSAGFIDYSQKTWLHWIEETSEVLWMSERDGWNHLWLFDGRTGVLKNQVTRGEWVVRSVEHVDEERRRLWLRVMGVRPGEDPYHFHLARVNFDGTGFVLLTEGDGTHRWQWSPDRRHFIDTWSRVDLPPATELRRAEDGALLARIEQADAAALFATGWRPPERFTAKGRDGATDIHGILIKPSHFDPSRRYPVIECIYAGPHDFFVPKEWGLQAELRAIAELGFVVVRIDGMGTNWRSRRFHQVAARNLKDSGLPDRIAWLKAAAESRPWLDLSRAGIYGGSAGGQSALAALLWHGDFYRAAAADCGCHDNRMDKLWWNEAWMGWPVGAQYAENSNVAHAARLEGKLLLTVGELDRNVDPASTLQVAKALVDAGKDFDLLILPGAGHGAGESPYAARRRLDFFVRHLHGVEPRRE